MIEGLCQCSINEKIGLTFQDTLRAIVRQDPDIIVLGEIRDPASANVAIESALIGHKVYTTFHTEDSVGALLRLIDMQIETFLIASTIVGIVSQRLARRICPECRQRYTPSTQVARAVGIEHRNLVNRAFYRGTGCPICHDTGYRGRIGVYEVLLLDPMIRDAILAKKASYELRKLCLESEGFVTMLEDGINKVYKYATTFEDILQKVPRLQSPRPIEQIRPIIDGTA